MKSKGSEVTAASSTGSLSRSSGASFTTAASVPVAANVATEKDASQSSQRSSRARTPSRSSRSSRRRRDKAGKGKKSLQPAPERPAEDDRDSPQVAGPEPAPVTTTCALDSKVVNPQDRKRSTDQVSCGKVRGPDEPHPTVNQEQDKPLKALQYVAQTSPPCKAKQRDEADEAFFPADAASPTESTQKQTQSSGRQGSLAGSDAPHHIEATTVEASLCLTATNLLDDLQRSLNRGIKAPAHSPSYEQLRKIIEEDMCPLDFSWPNMEVKTRQSTEARAAAMYRSCNGLLIGRRDDLPAVREALKEAGITWPRRPAKINILHTILATSLRLGWDVIFSVVPHWSPHPRLLLNSGRTIIEVLNKTTHPASLSKKRAYFTVLRENFLEREFRSSESSANEVTFDEVNAVEELAAAELRRSYYRPGVHPVALPDFVDVPELELSRDVWVKTLAVFGLDNSAGVAPFEIYSANPQYVLSFLQLWKHLGNARTHLFVSWYTVQVAALFANQALIFNYYDGDSRRALALHTAFCLGHAYAVSGPVVFSSYSRHTLRSIARHDAGSLTLAVRESFRKRVAHWEDHDEHNTVISNWTSLDTVFQAFGGNENPAPAITTAPIASGSDRIGDVTGIERAVLPDMTEESLVTNLRRTTTLFAIAGSRSNYTNGIEDTAISVAISTFHLSAALYGKGDFILIPYSLSFPLYDYHLIPAVNYGGLGAQVARMLGQLFIEAHRVPEHSRSWISRLEGCLLKTTLLEERNLFMTMAEAVSVGALVDAYDDHISDKGDENKRLPELQELTGRQLLFMALCFMKCRGRGAGKTPPWACNLPLMHMPDFARTFECSPGTPMNPVKKCGLV